MPSGFRRNMVFLLQHLLAETTRVRRDQEAVRCRGRSLTYGQVESASNGLARALIALGVRTGDRVGIFLPKMPEMVAAVYGVLKAGGVYVPLDPTAPLPRVAAMACDCGIKALISTLSRTEALLKVLGREGLAGAVLVDDGPDAADLPIQTISYSAATCDPNVADPGIPLIDLDLACILYTSGSTGVPKGVVHTHRSVLTFAEWWQAFMNLGPADRILNFTPLHFAPTLADLFGSAKGGATVVLLPESDSFFAAALERTLREERISVWITVPSALMLLTKVLGQPEAYPALRAIGFTGEVFPIKQLQELKRCVPDVELWNFYGSTETLHRSILLVDTMPPEGQALPLAPPSANVDFIVMTDEGKPAAVGEDGELYVRSSAVMRGYWGQPEKNAEVLVPHPGSRHLPELVFRTSDIVRLRPDGNFDFLGRKDHLIKLRGFRVELGDIEAALNSYPGVQESVAIPLSHPELGTTILALIVSRDDTSVSTTEVQQHVAARLPRYMIPARIELRKDLPHTSTGKIDRPRVLAEAVKELKVKN